MAGRFNLGYQVPGSRRKGNVMISRKHPEGLAMSRALSYELILSIRRTQGPIPPKENSKESATMPRRFLHRPEQLQTSSYMDSLVEQSLLITSGAYGVNQCGSALQLVLDPARSCTKRAARLIYGANIARSPAPGPLRLHSSWF